MNGNELIRRLKRLSRQTGVPVHHDGKPGKGSHGRLYYGSRFTTLKDPRKEIGAGLMNKMLADLGIAKDELNE
jgi:hypothetical protein